MGRIYTASFEPTAVSALVDVFEALAAADVPVLIHGWHLAQTSDLGDAAEEVLHLETVRGIGATSGSGGAAATETPIDVNSPATQTAVEVLNTTRIVAGGGSLVELEDYGWNIRLPWDFFYPPELRARVDPGELWTLGLPSAPADEITLIGTLWFEEL